MPKIVISKNAGYCMGVKRAFSGSLKIIVKDEDTCIYGEMVHNRFALQQLYDKGMIIRNDIEDIINDKKIKNVIIRAHGIPPSEEELLKKNKKSIFDFTCPKVKKVQLLAEKLSKAGYTIIIFGKRNHPEVIGIVGYCSNNYYVVKNIDEVKELAFEKIEKPAVISQTTMDSEIFIEICDYLKTRFNDLEIYNTLCRSPINIQDKALNLAHKVNAMLVVGDKSSANTTTLFEKVKKVVPSYFIETTENVDIEKLKKYQIIGITGGSSTPQWQMEKIKRYLTRLLNT